MTRSRQPQLPDFVNESGAVIDPQLGRVLSELSSGATAPPQLLRERLLSTIARPRLRYAPLFGALSELFDLGDAALAELFERAESPSQWSASPVPASELLHLTGGPRVAGADNGLVRLQAGARFPMHRHLGLERVLVLRGGYRDEPSGRVYGPGDLHEMSPDSSHAYTALPERELVLAVSVVSGVEVDGFGKLSPAQR
jgi:quercetin dioxygenase-like cupin family protein